MTNSFSSLFTSHSVRSALLEFAPVCLFGFIFHLRGQGEATLILMITTLLATLTTFILEKRIPYIPIYMTLLTLIFGYMTLRHHDMHYLQLRDTIYDFTFSGTLLLGFVFRKNLLKLAISSFLTLNNRAWNVFATLWIIFFFYCGVANEFVRHHYNPGTWVNYKLAMIFVTIAFTFASLLFVLRIHKKNEGVSVV
jgi:intracellular septation protein